jgi:hypothetical protein
MEVEADQIAGVFLAGIDARTPEQRPTQFGAFDPQFAGSCRCGVRLRLQVWIPRNVPH